MHLAEAVGYRSLDRDCGFKADEFTTMQLPEDFKEFIELMNSQNVRYVMIGGYAYNLYRNPRATGDIDFLAWQHG